MVNVNAVRSDAILVVDTDEGCKRYEVGMNIEFETKNGFVVSGEIGNINACFVTIKSEDSCVDYDITNIGKLHT